MKTWRRVWGIVLTGLVACSTAAGQADLSELLEPIRKQHRLPAIVGGIVTPEGLSATGFTGVRQLGSPDPVQPGDSFHLGSCTKAMTATLCAILVEEGRLRWDQTLAESFPDQADAMHPGFREVTLEQLLNHRAGFPANPGPPLWGELFGMPDGRDARRAVLVDAVRRAPAYEPGSDYLYSNTGYAIAGHLLETVVDQPWEAMMAERLFEPLGMSSAGFGAPIDEPGRAQPRGHTPDGQPVSPGPAADNPAAIGPAGTVHCSLEDWSKFIALHLRGSQADTDLLKRDTFRKLHAPLVDDANAYAYGWIVAPRPWANGPAWTHAGSNTMWYCVVWMAPRRDFAAMVMLNQAGPAAPTVADQAVSALIVHHLRHLSAP